MIHRPQSIISRGPLSPHNRTVTRADEYAMPKKPAASKQQGNPHIYLFYGEEFLIKERIEELFTDIMPSEYRSANLIVVDGANLDPADLAVQIFTPSLFGGPRVVHVEQTTLFAGGADLNKLLEKSLTQYRAGDRKGCMRTFGQALGIMGVNKNASQAEILDELGADKLNHGDDDIVKALIGEWQAGVKATAAAQGEAAMAALIERDMPEDAWLIFSATSLDKRKRLFKLLEKHGRAVECAAKPERFGNKLERAFIAERGAKVLERHGKRMSPSALEEIYKRAGSGIRELNSELEKLALYAGRETTITPEHVKALFTDAHDAAFYELSNSLRTRDLTKILPALHENIRTAAHPLMTLGLLASEIRKLITARELLTGGFKEIWRRNMAYKEFVAALSGLKANNPDLFQGRKNKVLAMKDYPLYLLLTAAQGFRMTELCGILENILNADIRLKSSKVGTKAPHAILERVIMDICSVKDTAQRT